MKKPAECDSINDIRDAIDEIDKNIISLITERASYVHEAAKFKSNVESVRAEDRVQKMLIKRREWAQERNMDPEFIEKLFQNIVDYFINKEMTKWKSKQK